MFSILAIELLLNRFRSGGRFSRLLKTQNPPAVSGRKLTKALRLITAIRHRVRGTIASGCDDEIKLDRAQRLGLGLTAGVPHGLCAR